MAFRTWRWPNAPKNEWGPKGWNWLHTLAINYPQNPTQGEGRVAYRRIWDFITHLPCAECLEHAARFVARRPPDLSSTHALQAWVWGFHNAVNARLGKRLVSYEEYSAAYADELCWANWHAGCLRAPARAPARAPTRARKG
jgi:mitochondrial FAD-linked sulfhydryl oxidase